MASGVEVLEATPISLSSFTLLLVLSVGLTGISPFAESLPIEMSFLISGPRDVEFMISLPFSKCFGKRVATSLSTLETFSGNIGKIM
uniref:Uncharacterized protein n=1 Tax=Solanum lycopersicum TaxID=4081 RepID=A0A3Q7G1S2_SOLLC